MTSASPKELLLEIQTSVEEMARRAGVSPERAFAAWYATMQFDIDEDAALEAAGLDGGEDHGVDFLHTDHASERVVLLQAHFPQNQAKAAPKSKLDALVSLLASFGDTDAYLKAGRPDLAEAIREAEAALERYEAVVGVVSLGPASDQIRRHVDSLNRKATFAGWRFFYSSRDEVLSEYEAVRGGHDNVAEDTLTFQSGKFFEDEGEYGRAWVGSVSGAELNRLYETHKDRLFARNIRLFLGSRKGGINEQIVATAKGEPGKFWALNNGITCVADTIAPTDVEGRFRLTRFSIVNGCQTTVSLSRAGAPAEAKVLARVVAANRAVVSDIVRYNNTQNAIKIWTVRASDAVQQRLQKALAQFSIVYAPKPDNRRYRGKNTEVMQLDRVAQYLACGGDTVIEAVKEKSELFDRHYQDIFPHDIGTEDVYLAWMLGTLADDVRQARLQALREQGDADKTQTALLGVAGTYWTVHCASKLVYALNPKPLKAAMSEMVTDQFKAALRKYVDASLDIFLDLAIDTFNPADYTSVRQALRSPKFLEKIDQKLANRVARFKTSKSKLPFLAAAAKSARRGS